MDLQYGTCSKWPTKRKEKEKKEYSYSFFFFLIFIKFENQKNTLDDYISKSVISV